MDINLRHHPSFWSKRIIKPIEISKIWWVIPDKTAKTVWTVLPFMVTFDHIKAKKNNWAKGNTSTTDPLIQVKELTIQNIVANIAAVLSRLKP